MLLYISKNQRYAVDAGYSHQKTQSCSCVTNEVTALQLEITALQMENITVYKKHNAVNFFL